MISLIIKNKNYLRYSFPKEKLKNKLKGDKSNYECSLPQVHV